MIKRHAPHIMHSNYLAIDDTEAYAEFDLTQIG
jgi:hypothetical protein